MSTSPNDAHEDGAEKQSVDELADANHTAEEAEAGEPTFSFPLILRACPVRNLILSHRDVGRLGRAC